MEAISAKEIEILSMIAQCGDFPTDLIGQIRGNSMSWNYMLVKGLQSKKLIKRYKKDGIASLRLTKNGEQQLLLNAPQRFAQQLSQSARYRQSAKQKRLRIHDIAAAKVMAYNAGFAVYPDQKPPVFGRLPVPGESVEWIGACFYDSFELKAQHDETVKIRSTRAVGCILTPSAGYFVYSVADRVIKWTSASERKLFSVAEGALLNWQIHYDHWEAVMIGQDYETAYKQLISDGGYRNVYFRLDQTYPAFYFITNDHAGEMQLRLICQPRARKRLRQYLLHRLSLTAVHDDTVFNCDARRADAFVLFAYEWDMEKLKQFKSGLEQFEEKGLVICLTEQQAVMARYFGDLAETETISLSLIEKVLAADG